MTDGQAEARAIPTGASVIPTPKTNEARISPNISAGTVIGAAASRSSVRAWASQGKITGRQPSP